MKRTLFFVCLVMSLGAVANLHAADWRQTVQRDVDMVPYKVAADWRQTGSDAEKLKNLVAAVPGTSHWMFELGERYKNLYWAGKQGKWEFANYQLEEIEKLVQLVQLTRPKRAQTAQEFLDSGIPQMHIGLATQKWDSFKASFNNLHAACMRCHAQNDHAFIVLPTKPKGASSPVLNLEMDDD